MKKFKKKIDQMIKSKKTTIILSIVLFTPFVIFGGILLRDTLIKGQPVEGSRFKDELAHEITKEQLKEIEEAIPEEMILKQEVSLKSATLRVYIEVSSELSWEIMEELGYRVYDKVVEILPAETYFTNSEDNKQYDLEINVNNDVEDLDSDDFLYLQIMKNGGMESAKHAWLSDPKDPEWKAKVLEMEEERIKAIEAEKAKEEGESGEE